MRTTAAKLAEARRRKDHLIQTMQSDMQIVRDLRCSYAEQEVQFRQQARENRRLHTEANSEALTRLRANLLSETDTAKRSEAVLRRLRLKMRERVAKQRFLKRCHADPVDPHRWQVTKHVQGDLEEWEKEAEKSLKQWEHKMQAQQSESLAFWRSEVQSERGKK